MSGASISSQPSTPEADPEYAALLQRCADGERTALRELYERESPRLMGVALRIVRRHELAHEVLHDAFLQIWQKAPSFDGTLGSARGWIYSIVRYRALDLLRKHVREQPLDDAMLDHLTDPGEGPLAQLSRGQDTDALHRCLRTLDDRKRTCILLAYVEGYSQTQIAEHLESPLGTVKAWIRRSLLTLKECLS